jgi:hypothetical protein
MDILDTAISKLTTLRDSFPDIAVKMLNEPNVKAQIEDKIIAQLQQGLKGDGSHLPNYSPVSVAKFGKPFGPIKLYDRGNYYKGITSKAFGNVLEIDDTDSKDPILTQRYGFDIRSLTDQSLQELQEEVFIPNMIAEVSRLL